MRKVNATNFGKIGDFYALYAGMKKTAITYHIQNDVSINAFVVKVRTMFTRGRKGSEFVQAFAIDYGL